MEFPGIKLLDCHFHLPSSFFFFSLLSPFFLHQKEFLVIRKPEKVKDKHFDIFILFSWKIILIMSTTIIIITLIIVIKL